MRAIGTMWTARVPDRAYAEAAAARLSSMKMPAPELLDHFRSQLRDLFAKRARPGPIGHRGGVWVLRAKAVKARVW